jgi:MFS superfamily sulfate permease-like transporter
VGLAVVSVALARAIRGSGATRAGLIALITGAIAAIISLVQCFLGVALARASAPGSAHLLWELVDRLDGIKMLMLALLALAAAVATVLPRWMRYVSGALAISIAGSGLAYLFLLNSQASLAYVAGVLLLVFIPGAAFTLRRAGGR